MDLTFRHEYQQKNNSYMATVKSVYIMFGFTFPPLFMLLDPQSPRNRRRSLEI
jgi:hypothetical protein